MATRPEKVVIWSESFKRVCANGCVKSNGSETTVHGHVRIRHLSIVPISLISTFFAGHLESRKKKKWKRGYRHPTARAFRCC